jgi:uncharacterized protein (TIGR02452 family)
MDAGTLRKQLDIPREVASRLGRQAVSIIEAGRYKAPSGRNVEIGPRVELSVRGTVTYPPLKSPAAGARKSLALRVEVQNETTLAAVRRLLARGCRPAALNMASAVSPGGGFLNGARAQEEYLCRSSALFACLRGSPMYAFHAGAQDPFYSDWVIYSPDVPVFRDDDAALLDEPYPCSFLTSPAVMAKAVHRYMPQRAGEIEPVMRKRTGKLLTAAAAHGHTSLVLGAWGCGAFGNDGDLVAGIFHEALHGEFRGAFDHVVFAVTDWSEEGRFIGPFARRFA